VRYAAIDIGSNSVRLLIADTETAGDRLRVTRLHEDREVTRLGASVFNGGMVDEKTLAHVSSVLRRFGEANQKHNVAAVRAVATSATRDASNREVFLAAANEALGAPIETISGQEEARLIHLGVESVWPQPAVSTLIVDVGGGSAELIAAEGGRLTAAFSRPLGAVRLQEVFLQQDPPTPRQLQNLVEFIDEKLALPVKTMAGKRYGRVVATSASAAALVCAVNRIARVERDAADRRKATTAQIRKLYTQLAASTIDQRRKIPGIGPRRAEIIIPGAAVYQRVLEIFQQPALHYSIAGVRDGIIADLAQRGAGRARTQLTREQRRVVEALARRYGVTAAHARRVAEHAHQLFAAFQKAHRLAPEWGRLLEAASYLRDTGHFISSVGHHKHSAYVVMNSDLAGFTDHERFLISMLCRYHRKAMPTAKHVEFQKLGEADQRAVILLAPLLRLADALDRSREQRVEAVEVALDDKRAMFKPRGAGNITLEMWAVERAAPDFTAAYGLALSVVRAGRL
jgi:exopolyphosphatase/guanosine-5'-triphosphate,3'-diphosphate pyrophosphatase